MGFAVGLFDDSLGLVVPRCRFLPVKRTTDLFLVQSNLFNLENGKLLRNPARTINELPLIKFGKELNYYKNYRDSFEEIPDLIELESLKLDGKFQFGKNVILKGNIDINSEKKTCYVTNGTLIEMWAIPYLRISVL